MTTDKMGRSNFQMKRLKSCHFVSTWLHQLVRGPNVTGGHQPHQGQNVLGETETRMIEVKSPRVTLVESEETTDSRKGVQADDHAPKRTDESTIGTHGLPSTAGALVRVVKPPKRDHLEEGLFHTQIEEGTNKRSEFVRGAQSTRQTLQSTQKGLI